MTGYITPVRTKAGWVKSKAVFLTEFSKIRKKRKRKGRKHRKPARRYTDRDGRGGRTFWTLIWKG